MIRLLGAQALGMDGVDKRIRMRLGEVPRDREIHLICRSGQRAYIATRMLLQKGFKTKTVSRGMLSLAQNYLFDTDKEVE